MKLQLSLVANYQKLEEFNRLQKSLAAPTQPTTNQTPPASDSNPTTTGQSPKNGQTQTAPVSTKYRANQAKKHKQIPINVPAPGLSKNKKT